MNYELIVFKGESDLGEVGTDGDGVQQGLWVIELGRF